MNDTRLKGKDLINIGIYTALAFVIAGGASMIGFIPVLLPLLTIICPVLMAIPLMLFYTKVKKFGMIWISTSLMGIIMWVTGMGIYPAIVGIIVGLIADLIYTKSGFASKKMAVLSYAVSQLYIWANYLELYFNRDAYIAARPDFGAEYWETLETVMPMWSCPVLLIVTFVSGIIGALIGMKLMKKHFAKAGII